MSDELQIPQRHELAPPTRGLPREVCDDPYSVAAFTAGWTTTTTTSP